MAFRLIAGRTFLADVSWFSKSIPAFFHVVLASYLLTLGHYIRRRTTASSAILPEVAVAPERTT